MFDFAAGAGEGNRTLVVSLGSFCSAIELHPPAVCELAAVPHRVNDIAPWNFAASML